MRRFRDILFVPLTERTEAPVALDEAFRLAAANGARLTLHGDVAEPPLLQQAVGLGDGGPDVTTLLVAEMRDRLRAWVAAMDPGDVPIEVDVAVGHRPLEVVRKVREGGHDLVIVAADGSEESAADVRRILRVCPCPVWVLRPPFGGRRVLAAVDPDHAPELNRLILELGRSQAHQHGGELHVVHAWEPHGAGVLADCGHPSASATNLSLRAVDIERAHRVALEEVLCEAGLVLDRNVHFVDGRPVRAITGLIDLYRIDLLVMGSVGRSSRVGVDVGSTAEQVLAEVDRSVLVVKPPGFDAPVRV